MSNDFNLSDKKEIFEWLERNNYFQGMKHDCLIKDVLKRIEKKEKEFIKQLKEEFSQPDIYSKTKIFKTIDKLAGSKL